ncbi:MAG: helix-turn-helix domain-containing protein [Mogibacterium sp.]|nr:helix-turn-helix domain-containing protein [Mogibacterium sp.]
MKLNATILYDLLKDDLKLEVHGSLGTDFTLKRPRFYLGDETVFLKNQLYIARSSLLPPNPRFEKGCAILCVGGRPPSAYYYGKALCITVNAKIEIIRAFDMVQRVYDRFDHWDEEMREIVRTTGDLNELLRITYPILENPMQVLDSRYRFLAYSDIIDQRDELKVYRPDDRGGMPLQNVEQCIDDNRIFPTAREVLHIEVNGTDHLSANLFSRDEYIGSLTVACAMRRRRPSDDCIISYFAHVLEEAISRQTLMFSGEMNMLRSVLTDALEGIPIDGIRMSYIERTAVAGYAYVCIKLMMSSAASDTMISDYICSEFEDAFAGCIAFIHDGAIILCMKMHQEEVDSPGFTDRLTAMLEPMQMKAAMSDPFADPSEILTYYKEASIAFEIGMTQDSGKTIYRFRDYVLPYMVMHSVGEFATETLLSEGIRKLMQHDAEDPDKAQYVETLQVYLRCNMNLSRASRELYIHKSTLVARLERIQGLLGADLEDPDARLTIQILLKQIEYSSPVV